MEILYAAILGIVEGLTEFLPISSTGHLIVVSHWLGIEQTNNHKAFEVIIQFAAILAVITHYKSRFTPKEISLWTKVFIAFLPIAIFGLLFHDDIKMLFNLETVAGMFIIGGIFIFICELFYDERLNDTTSLDKITFSQSAFIGIMQVAALIPGTSRAGASIVGGMLINLDRKTAAEFSFLLALPVLAASSGFDLLKNYNEFLTNGHMLTLLVGFVVSYIVAYFTMKLFLVFLQTFSFKLIAWYRILFGIMLFVFFV